MMDFQKRLTGYYHKRFSSRRNLSISNVDDITRGWEAQLIKFNIEFQENNQHYSQEFVARIFHGEQAIRESS